MSLLLEIPDQVAQAIRLPLLERHQQVMTELALALLCTRHFILWESPRTDHIPDPTLDAQWIHVEPLKTAHLIKFINAGKKRFFKT